MADFTIVRSHPVGARRRPRVHPLKYSEVGVNKDHRNVFLRIKPSKKPQRTMFETVDGNTLVPVLDDHTKLRKGISHRYKFTKIFDAHKGQDHVFKESCLTPLSNFINGTNSLLFAYGATNAGKTFTIQGTPEKPGIIPRALNLLFNSIKGKVSKDIRFKPEKLNNLLWLTPEEVQKEFEIKQSMLDVNLSKNKTVRSASALSTFSEESVLGKSYSSNNNSADACSFFQAMKANLDDEVIPIENDLNNVYSIWISFVEIYNENLYDLLQPFSKRKPLTLGENERKDVYIKGLTDVCVFTPEEAFEVFLFGKHNLHQASTSINHVSSRSHCIFTLKLVKHFNVECPTFAQVSMCTFVDLAGSERAKKTCNVGERMKESQCINTSLHVLGKCIDVLRYNQKTREQYSRMLPCRESKLTRLFQRALEGKEILTMIVNISQDPKLFDETLNVLKFSAIAMELQFDRFDSSTVCSLRNSSFASYMDKFSSSFQTLADSRTDTSECERYMKLLAYVEELKNSLQVEKKKNTTLEARIRKEAYTQFRQIMKSMEDSHKQQLEAQRDMYDDYVETNAIMYQKTLHNTRKRYHDDSDQDEEEEEVLLELKEKIQFLENKIEALTVLVESGEQLKFAHSTLQAKYTKLQFELASTKKELEESSKINKCFELQGDNQLVIDELRSQLSTQQSLVKEQNQEIEDLKKLLEEAKSDYDEHFKEHEDFYSRNEDIQKIMADQEMKIEDLIMQLNICNKKLSQLQQNVNEKELEEAELPKKLQLAYEDRDELKFQVSHLKNEIVKLRTQNDEKRNLPSTPCDFMALEALVASHEDKIKQYEVKLKREEESNKSLREEISSIKTSSFSSNQDTYEKEISILQKEIKDCVKSKKELEYKMETLTKENEELRDKLRYAELAVETEQENTKSLRRIWDSEKEKYTEEVSRINHTLLDVQNNFEELAKEHNNLKAWNLELKENIKVKEEELEGFKCRRDAQFTTYESMLKNERTLREREQQEAHQIQNVLRAATPQKQEQLISELKKESVSISNEVSHKQRLKQNTRSDEENSLVSVVEVPSLPATSVKPDPEGRQLRPRRKKVLYTVNDEVLPPRSTRRRP